MKASMVATLFMLAVFAPADANPISKVISMIGDLEAKVIEDGKVAAGTYNEFAELCETRAKELTYEIKTGKADSAALSSTIEKATADISAFTTKIDELATSVATATADLKAAKDIRAKEAADFAAEEKDLVLTIGTLDRAITVIKKEMGSGASMLQLKNAQTVAQALAVMVQASALNGADAQRLTALVQSSSASDDSDEALGAPAGATYESHSGGIVEVLEGLHDKADEQLKAARKAETDSLSNFEMLEQSLKDEIKYGGIDMDKAKKNLAEASETKGTAEGDLEVTTKDLNEDTTAFSDLHHECMDKAQAFETETTARGEELKALATAKKIIEESTSGAAAQSYGLDQVSFLQVSEPASRGFAAVHFVRRLAKKQNSKVLAQLAMKMASAVQSSSSANPFEKIKGLVRDMIEKLEKEAGEDASKKGFCDKEMSETAAKIADLTATIDKLSTKIDQMSTTSAKLMEEVAVLQKELADLAATQAEMDKIRREEKSEFTTNKAELEQGVAGLQLALKTLRDYYAKGDASASADAGGGIISMLEVVESDFTKNLQDVQTTEAMAAAAYDKETKENSIEKAMKDQDVKYKTKEAKGLDESVAEASSDKTSAETELAAVMEYKAKIDAQCIEKATPYAEKKAAREQEIAGLKEALEILNSEAALIQKGTVTHVLRGARA